MRRFSSALFFVLATGAGLQAQRAADFSKVSPGQTVLDGFYFYLPRTAAEIEFTVVETRYKKGELADYAGQYFQSRPEIARNNSQFSIENVSVKPYPVADPSQQYRYSAETASQANIQTVCGGIIKSINAPVDIKSEANRGGAVSSFSRGDDSNDARVPFFSLGTRSDTVINREVRADSTVIERRVVNRRTVSNTPEEMARESVQKLDDIRKIRYTLISGPEDINLDGTGLQTSLKELEKTEQELLALFFGRSKKITQTYRITYIPSESPDTLFYLSPENGVSMSPNSSYPPVRVSVKPFSGKVSAPQTSGAAQSGVIPYRSAEKMILSVQWNGSKYFETEIMLPQYGQVHAVPVKKIGALRVVYDENTGAIESIGPALQGK